MSGARRHMIAETEIDARRSPRECLKEGVKLVCSAYIPSTELTDISYVSNLGISEKAFTGLVAMLHRLELQWGELQVKSAQLGEKVNDLTDKIGRQVLWKLLHFVNIVPLRKIEVVSSPALSIIRSSREALHKSSSDPPPNRKMGFIFFVR